MKKDRKGQYIIPVEGQQDTFIVHVKNVNFEGFALKYKVQGTYYYQHLMLSCRGGAQKYFPFAAQLYRAIKKDKATNLTFKYLAA